MNNIYIKGGNYIVSINLNNKKVSVIFLLILSLIITIISINNHRLNISIYPDIFCFDKTAEDDKIYKDFPFDKDGLDAAMEYIEDSIVSIN